MTHVLEFKAYHSLASEAKEVLSKIFLKEEQEHENPLNVLYTMFFGPITMLVEPIIDLGISFMSFAINKQVKTEKDLKQKLFDFAKKNLDKALYKGKTKKQYVFILTPKFFFSVSENIETATNINQVTYTIGGAKATLENYKKLQKMILKEMIKESFVNLFLSLSARLQKFLLRKAQQTATKKT